MLAGSCGFGEATRVLESPPSSSRGVTPSSVRVVTPSPTPATPASATPPAVPPAIVVRSPQAGAKINTPVTVSGLADVAGGLVSIRILDASGAELSATNVVPSCGAGCRGRFSMKLPFYTPVRQPGTVQVFEPDPKTGAALFVVEVSVTLVP